MTLPKRRVGNPLGDSKISKVEEGYWSEAYHFVKLLEKEVEAEVKYLEGRGPAPTANAILKHAQLLWQAEQGAICVRRGRTIEKVRSLEKKK